MSRAAALPLAVLKRAGFGSSLLRKRRGASAAGGHANSPTFQRWAMRRDLRHPTSASNVETLGCSQASLRDELQILVALTGDGRTPAALSRCPRSASTPSNPLFVRVNEIHKRLDVIP